MKIFQTQFAVRPKLKLTVLISEEIEYQNAGNDSLRKIK